MGWVKFTIQRGGGRKHCTTVSISFPSTGKSLNAYCSIATGLRGQSIDVLIDDETGSLGFVPGGSIKVGTMGGVSMGSLLSAYPHLRGKRVELTLEDGVWVARGALLA